MLVSSRYAVIFLVEGGEWSPRDARSGRPPEASLPHAPKRFSDLMSMSWASFTVGSPDSCRRVSRRGRPRVHPDTLSATAVCPGGWTRWLIALLNDLCLLG